MYRITSNSENFVPVKEIAQQKIAEGVETEVTLSKEDLVIFLNTALSSKGLEQFSFAALTNYELKGNTTVLGLNVPYRLQLEPFVMVNGNIQLKVHSVHISSFRVPVSTILAVVSSNPSLPEWLKIYSNEAFIVIDLENFEVEQGVTIRAKRIDPETKAITFQLILANHKIQSLFN